MECTLFPLEGNRCADEGYGQAPQQLGYLGSNGYLTITKQEKQEGKWGSV